MVSARYNYVGKISQLTIPLDVLPTKIISGIVAKDPGNGDTSFPPLDLRPKTSLLSTPRLCQLGAAERGVVQLLVQRSDALLGLEGWRVGGLAGWWVSGWVSRLPGEHLAGDQQIGDFQCTEKHAIYLINLTRDSVDRLPLSALARSLARSLRLLAVLYDARRCLAPLFPALSAKRDLLISAPSMRVWHTASASPTSP